MKKSQITEFRSKSREELKKILEERKLQIKKLMVEVNTRKLKNTASLGQRRKEVALILTLIREKELIQP